MLIDGTGNVSVYNTPSSNNHVANKAYVDTKTTDMATTSAVTTAITNALNNGSMANNPTVADAGNVIATYRVVFSNTSSGRAGLLTDGELYYNPNANTLYATTFSGALSGNASTASTAVNNQTFRIGNNVTTESTIIRDEHKGTIALFVKALSNARANRPFNVYTSNALGGYYLSPDGMSNGSNNNVLAFELVQMGGSFVAVFEGIIQVGCVIAGSDKRMKKNITEITDGTKSLQLFRKIKCSTFEYVDKFSHSPYKVHGFIAQDIKDIVPEAVHLVPDYLPNFYCMCSMEKYSIQYNDKTETFRVYIPVNDVKKLIFTGNHDIKTGIEYKTASGAPASDASGNQNFKVKFKDSSDNDVEVITTWIIDDFSFLIEVPLNDKGENTVIKEDTYFLYGQTVDDFHKIDNDHIHNIATAALQEVDRQQQADKVRIAELENHVSILESTVANQQSLINDILERLKKVGA
jgi:hypothetical protein